MKKQIAFFACFIAITSNSNLLPEDVRMQQAEQYKKEEQYAQAIAVYDEILSQDPHSIEALFELATSCLALGKTSKALMALDKLNSMFPNNHSILHNIGYTQKMAGNLDKTIELYLQNAHLNPSDTRIHLGLAHTYLQNGDFVHGWNWYRKTLINERDCSTLIDWMQQGTLSGKRILLQPEGGLGDIFQFIRYAQPLHAAGAHVIVVVPRTLKKIFSLLPYIDTLVCTDEAWPDYDTRATMMSLPAVFAQHEQDLGACVPYLTADEHLVSFWHENLAKDTHFKIGLCWHADGHNDRSRLPVARRSIPLTTLELLSNLPHVSFYSLQQREGLEELTTLPSHFNPYVFDTDFDQTHGNFMDTAAVMKNLDLIITVDTATAHLAGGLGVPVVLLLPFSTDWRWLAHRTDSPWYPSMRILQQRTPFDWEALVQELYLVLTERITLLESK